MITMLQRNDHKINQIECNKGEKKKENKHKNTLL